MLMELGSGSYIDKSEPKPPIYDKEFKYQYNKENYFTFEIENVAYSIFTDFKPKKVERLGKYKFLVDLDFLKKLVFWFNDKFVSSMYFKDFLLTKHGLYYLRPYECLKFLDFKTGQERCFNIMYHVTFYHGYILSHNYVDSLYLPPTIDMELYSQVPYKGE